ncbi:C39 family peptidase [Lachnoclostridium pacaense]|uniref:C39 family peptidase n=1 Tax=Enterocloster hominis (ex Hitch et al. 2024) TaxID=1917870 RepID=UPI001D0FBE2C|nr:C39 family peptidase [Lachnoclostridium pacaense]MCC2821000.1 C39 family peptidase [Lachnoclostridium pacaense]
MKKVKKYLICLIGSMVLPIVLVLFVFSGLGGGGKVIPADEEIAVNYETCGNHLGVDWSWIMLLDMHLADLQKTKLEDQNPVYTGLNCLKVTIEVYVKKKDEDGDTYWKYDHTDYANGAVEIFSYFGLSVNCRDAQQVKRAIENKNSEQYRISTAPYSTLDEIIDTYYSDIIDEATKTDILEMDKEKYLPELYVGILGNLIGNEGISGDYDFGDLVYPEIGMEIPLYYQYQEPWGNVRFGGNVIRTSGCSVTCIAMVYTYLLDKTLTPADIVAWTGNRYYVGNAGQSWGIFPGTASNWGVKCYNLGTSWQTVIRELSDGHPVIASMMPGTFTKAGHFIVLRGITEDGRILVNDPNDNGTKRFFYTSFAPALIKREAKQYWSFSE